MSSAGRPKRRDGEMKAWLAGFIFVVLSMIAIGGITRITRSGLSIVDWRPVVGMIPPLSENDWTIEFNKYKKTPEYEISNSHFTLQDYKSIYVWEFVHRLLGRLLFVYALIFGMRLWFMARDLILIPLSLAAFIVLQGCVGWIMVKSGLKAVPSVSPYLLSLHYFLALGLLVYAFYFLCSYRKKFVLKSGDRRFMKIIGISLAPQIFYGCLMSGFKAGYLADTFPLMGGSFLPGNPDQTTPVLQVVKNPLLIHWLHRWIGVFTFALIVVFASVNIPRASLESRVPLLHFVGISSAQIILGIGLIIYHIPAPAAVTHQIVAALIVLAYFNIVFRTSH